MKAIVEAKIGNKTILKLNLWSIVLRLFFLDSVFPAASFDAIQIYLNGEKVEKPPEMEAQQ